MTKKTPDPQPQSPLSNRRQRVIVWLAYAALAVLMTWPVARDLGSRLAGSGPDIWSHQWTFHWVRDSLLAGQSPYFSRQIFHPVGVSLATHNIAWLHILLWIPLQAIFNTTAAYNLIFLGILATSGLGLYLLAVELGATRSAAFVGGLVFAFWPYILSQHEHPNIMFLSWAPFLLLSLRRLLQNGRKRDLAGTAVFIALTGWARWQLLIMVALLAGLYLLYLFLIHPNYRRLDRLHWLLAAAVLAGVLMAPIAAPVAAYQLRRDHPEDIFLDERETKQTDLLAYFVPSNLHALRDTAVFAPIHAVYQRFDVQNQIRTPYLGYTALLLALLAVIARWRQARFWALAALLLILLALGPQLRLNGVVYPFPMPYQLVGDNVLIRLLRVPDRFNLLLGLPFAVMAAQGVTALQGRLRGSRPALLITGLAALLILAEYLPVPYPQSDLHTPEWLAELAQDPEEYALLHLPQHLFEYNKPYMFYQTRHGKPIANGKVARVPREALSFWDSTPLLRAFFANDLVIEQPDVTHQLQALAAADIRYVVLHRSFAEPGQLAVWQDWFSYQPYYEDEELIVYRTTPEFGREIVFRQPLTEAIGLMDVAVTPSEAVQGGVVKVDARWGARQAPGQELDACLTLVDDAQTAVSTICHPLSLAWPSSRWQANEVVRGRYAIPVESTLPPGQYELQLTLATSDTGQPVGETAVLAPVTIHPFDPDFDAAIRWQDGITLAGFDAEGTADQLRLQLYWQTGARVTASYKVFVHLIDPQTGAVVAQSDHIPRDWTYPTTAWEPGEIVRDPVTLSLADVPPGRYDLYVGFYAWETTGVRLPLLDGDAASTTNAAFLTTIKR